MHATIDVESEVSRGSVFTVRIPFQIARAEAVPTAEPEQGTTLERIRILLAEDNELNRITEIKQADTFAYSSSKNFALRLEAGQIGQYLCRLCKESKLSLAPQQSIPYNNI